MCKRNSPDKKKKKKANTGYVRDIPQINMKPARDVCGKLPRQKQNPTRDM